METMPRTRFNPLDHMNCLERPRYRTPSRWTEHVPFAFYLVGALEPYVVVDLATDDVALYLGFCQAIESLKLKTDAFAVRPPGEISVEDDDSLAALRALQEPRYSQFSRVLETTTDQAAALFDLKSIDLLRLSGNRDVDVVAQNSVPGSRK